MRPQTMRLHALSRAFVATASVLALAAAASGCTRSEDAQDAEAALPTAGDWGFAIAKIRDFLDSPE